MCRIPLRCSCGLICLIIAVIAVILSMTSIANTTPPDVTDNRIPAVMSGEVVPKLANRISEFRSLAEAREMAYDKLLSSVDNEMWDTWVIEELDKVALQHNNAQSLFEDILNTLIVWYEGWRVFKKTMASISTGLDRGDDIRTRIFNFLEQYGLTAIIDKVDPQHRVIQDQAVCQLARKEVEHIANLSIPTQLLPNLQKLYNILNRMHQTIVLISNSTGDINWQQAQMVSVPYSCLARNLTVEECGTAKQKRTMRLMAAGLTHALGVVKADYVYAAYLYDRLGWECKRVQRLQLRGCSFEIRCADNAMLGLLNVTLPAREVFDFIQRSVRSLLQ